MDEQPQVLVETGYEGQSGSEDHTEQTRQSLEEVGWPRPRWMHDRLLRVLGRNTAANERLDLEQGRVQVRSLERSVRDCLAGGQ
jgi:hypothetical protein